MTQPIITGASVYRTRARWIGDQTVQYGRVTAVVGTDAVVRWTDGQSETVRVADLTVGLDTSPEDAADWLS